MVPDHFFDAQKSFREKARAEAARRLGAVMARYGVFAECAGK